MNDERFIELAKRFLTYSLSEIAFEYRYLTSAEKSLISEEEFEAFVTRITE